jgi:hypothetical protein
MPDAERYRRFADECPTMAEEEDNCGSRQTLGATARSTKHMKIA